MKQTILTVVSISLIGLCILTSATWKPVQANTEAGTPILISKSGHTLAYGFRFFYEQHNGQVLFGLPLTEVFLEDGRPVQYFERVRFEWHAEIPGVQIGHLGSWATQDNRNAPPFQWLTEEQTPPEATYVPQSGHSLRGRFRDFWLQNGAEEVFGYPISEQYSEQQSETGQRSMVQYFQRARFELHSSNAQDEPQVVLGNLGREYLATVPPPAWTTAPVQSAAYAWNTVRPTHVRIPRVGVDTQVIEMGYSHNGWDVPNFAAVHSWPIAAYPGTVGNIVIAGHVSIKDTLFHKLPEVTVGDEVVVAVADNEHRYVVHEILTLLPTDTWVLEPTSKEVLTLITCVPNRGFTHRLIVRANPIGARTGGDETPMPDQSDDVSGNPIETPTADLLPENLEPLQRPGVPTEPEESPAPTPEPEWVSLPTPPNGALIPRW